jgi:hypothetical protein
LCENLRIGELLQDEQYFRRDPGTIRLSSRFGRLWLIFSVQCSVFSVQHSAFNGSAAKPHIGRRNPDTDLPDKSVFTMSTSLLPLNTKGQAQHRQAFLKSTHLRLHEFDHDPIFFCMIFYHSNPFTNYPFRFV